MGYVRIGQVSVWGTPKSSASKKKKQKSKKEYKEWTAPIVQDVQDPLPGNFNEGKKDDCEWYLQCNKEHKIGKLNLGDVLYIKGVNSERKSRLPTHPLETGMVRHDHKIVDPRTVTVNCLVDSVDKNRDPVSKEVAKELEKMLWEKDLKDFVNIKSPMESYNKLYLQSYKDTTEQDKTDVFSFTLTFQELLLSRSKNEISDNADFKSTSDKGGAAQK